MANRTRRTETQSQAGRQFEYEHDWSSDRELSYTIIQAVATATGKQSEELGPLYAAVDVDAVDALLRESGQYSSERKQRRVSFRFEDCIVSITEEGTITVTPLSG